MNQVLQLRGLSPVCLPACWQIWLGYNTYRLKYQQRYCFTEDRADIYLSRFHISLTGPYLKQFSTSHKKNDRGPSSQLGCISGIPLITQGAYFFPFSIISTFLYLRCSFGVFAGRCIPKAVSGLDSLHGGRLIPSEIMAWPSYRLECSTVSGSGHQFSCKRKMVYFIIVRHPIRLKLDIYIRNSETWTNIGKWGQAYR